MRNPKKLVAVVLTGALILTSINPVFAAINDEAGIANADKAAALKNLGLYSGQDANDPRVGLNDALTTQDSLIFLAKLFGYNEAANALTADQVAEGLAKFDDAASIADYAKNVVAYSATNSILSGSTRDDKFFVGAKDTVTAARFATFMLRQMGYTVPDYKKSVAMLAETKGSKIDAALTGDLTRDDAVGVMYGALTAEKASGKTVLVDIIGNRADLRARAEEAGLLPPSSSSGGGSGSGSSYVPLAATTVKALNNKQLMVTFSVPMDKESAENQSNYIVKDRKETEKSLTNTSCKLGSDRKTVTITLDSTVQDCLTNASLAEVIVNKNILAANGEKLGTDKVFEVPIQDGILPTVTEAKGVGNQLIEIVFSEPVCEGGNNTATLTPSNFSVKSGTYNYSVEKAELDLNVIHLELGTKLIEGPISVTVNDAGLGGNNVIQDYAGYKVFKSTHSFNFVKDTSVAVVTVQSASQDRITLNFTKPIKGKDIRLYHSMKNVDAYKAEDVTTEGYVDELTFSFSSPLPTGNVNLYLVNSGTSEYQITDAYGIKVPNQTLTAWLEEDGVPPAILGLEVNRDESIGISFDEDLDEKVASDPDSYSLTRLLDGKEIPLKALLEDSTKVLLTFHDGTASESSTRLQDNQEYRLVIKKYQDVRRNKNTNDYEYTFTTGDHKSPEVITDPESGQRCLAIPEAGKIFIVYSEPMNQVQMLDKENYMVSTDHDFAPLGDDDEITKVNDWTVQIYSKTLDELNNPEITPSVKIAPIMDISGKRLYNSVEAHIVQGIPSEDVVIEKAELTSKDKIKITFSAEMKNVDKEDIKIDLQSQDFINIAGTESQRLAADGKTEVVFRLGGEIGTDATAPGGANILITTIDAPSSEAVSGRKLKAGSVRTLEDRVPSEVIFFDHDADPATDPAAKIIASGDMVTSPTGILVPQGTTGTITISFTEPISPDSLFVRTFVVKGYVVENISCIGTDLSEIALVVKSVDAPARPKVTQVYNIRDGAGNVLPSGTTWTILFNSEVDHGQETT